MLLPNNNQENDYHRLDANESPAGSANTPDAQNHDEIVPAAVVNRVNFEIGLQSTLVGIAGAFVVYLYHPVISNSSNYVCGDWRTLRENKHYLDELSFYDLKASWAIGVLPAVLIQIYNLVEYSLSSQWCERVFQSLVFLLLAASYGVAAYLLTRKEYQSVKQLPIQHATVVNLTIIVCFASRFIIDIVEEQYYKYSWRKTCCSLDYHPDTDLHYTAVLLYVFWELVPTGLTLLFVANAGGKFGLIALLTRGASLVSSPPSGQRSHEVP